MFRTGKFLSIIIYRKYTEKFLHASTFIYPIFSLYIPFPSQQRTAKKLATIKPIKFKPKSTGKFVRVWYNITVQQLSGQLNYSLDRVYELLWTLPHAQCYDDPSAHITDMRVVRDLIRMVGCRMMVVANPYEDSHSTDTQQEEKEDGGDVRDAFPRPVCTDVDRLVHRPPVVSIMGHVDHGKTTLLDALRHSNIVQSEHGGITQHIGAFSVNISSRDVSSTAAVLDHPRTADTITFLDTPGHAAFSSMRERGARVTDIVVLVVAADDGCMQQTVQSVQFAARAQVPIVVAINKCDKPHINIEATKESLRAAGVCLESTTGCSGEEEVPYVCISALRGEGLTNLIETILAVAELNNIRCDNTGFVEGHIIETRSDPHRGKLSTLLVTRGTLRKGNVLVAGCAWCKVRAMFDENGRVLSEVTPGFHAEIIGWRSMPSAGDLVLQVTSEKRASEVILYRNSLAVKQVNEKHFEIIQQKIDAHLSEYRAQRQKKLEMGIRFRMRPPVERLKENTATDSRPVLHLLLKGDVGGSLEAILDVLDTYHEPEIRLDLVHYGHGDVTKHDVELAATFNGVIYAFNVKTAPSVLNYAKGKTVHVFHCNVIYRLIQDIQERLNALMPDVDYSHIHGEAIVQQQFMINEGKYQRPVAGSRCVSGCLKKNLFYRLVRGDETLHEGKLTSMRHLKEEVTSINKGIECGLMLEDAGIQFEFGDRLICYEVLTKKPLCGWSPGF